ncbi:hypothetical protein EN871_27910 [bacterium M00.F.Ca.ET.228.01.1.1]|nr:hypothetical protein EN871_27910 [bacterium M00.F.Ca.ET.228.01.1.1]TGR96670.1 hypothetical protein EN834_27080 [bacterium M00.F.Ca.ET.191.01.1.1]TGT97937.1 hypothetical protein EN798_27085 [bacterium M00.F.Ca.ET.155.01.1.1]
MVAPTAPAKTDSLQPWEWWVSYLRALGGAWSRLDTSFQQPILPGWSFAGVVVNENNSSDPAMEHVIASRQSYGKQIGRMMDVVAELSKLSSVDRNAPPFKEFFEVVGDIEKIKREAADARFEKTLLDLEALKKGDQKKFEQCLRRVAALR